MPALRLSVHALLIAASLAACGHDITSGPRAKTPRSNGAQRVTAPAPEESPDVRVADAVRRELEVDAAVDAERISVAVNEGVVELSGVVPHLLMAAAAISRAETVHGVRTVIDRMELARDGLDDDVVRARVEAALDADPAIEILAPSVRVIDGVVTLRGRVPSLADRQLAEQIARAVRGARDVVSQIEIRADPRADAEVLDAVQHALRADRWVDEWLLEVEVDDGVVAMRGVQPTAAAKRRAVNAAWVAGVRDVDATLVAVEPELAPAQRRPPEGYAYPDDAEIRSSISTVIGRDPRLRGDGVDVRVRDGIVTLRGRAETLDAQRAATQLAESVHGVWRVENELTVARARWVSDAALGTAIEEALGRAAAIDDDAVTAVVTDGVVTLTGRVQTPYARTVADDVIARIPGVRGLDNQIEAPAAREGPPADDVLLQDVIAHLDAHPYVDPSQVEVTVSQGEVMLRGTVSDWRAERDAIRAAQEAGATNVLDAIEVEEGPEVP